MGDTVYGGNTVQLGCPREWFFDFRRNTEFFGAIHGILRNFAEFRAYSHKIFVCTSWSFTDSPLQLKYNKKIVEKIVLYGQ
jgi:hypothetical protein